MAFQQFIHVNSTEYICYFPSAFLCLSINLPMKPQRCLSVFLQPTSRSEHHWSIYLPLEVPSTPYLQWHSFPYMSLKSSFMYNVSCTHTHTHTHALISHTFFFLPPIKKYLLQNVSPLSLSWPSPVTDSGHALLSWIWGFKSTCVCVCRCVCVGGGGGVCVNLWESLWVHLTPLAHQCSTAPTICSILILALCYLIPSGGGGGGATASVRHLPLYPTYLTHLNLMVPWRQRLCERVLASEMLG